MGLKGAMPTRMTGVLVEPSLRTSDAQCRRTFLTVHPKNTDSNDTHALVLACHSLRASVRVSGDSAGWVDKQEVRLASEKHRTKTLISGRGGRGPSLSSSAPQVSQMHIFALFPSTTLVTEKLSICTMM